MRNLSGRLFRPLEKAELLCRDGTRRAGRGLTVRLREEAGGLTGRLPHGLGNLDTPLYTFTGDLEDAAPGDTLVQGGAAYTVLRAERLTLGGAKFGLRAVLERREEPGEGRGNGDGA